MTDTAQPERSQNLSSNHGMAGALDGLRVLDMSRVLAGPICGQILSDLGAEVIKVEKPGKGDDSRAWGPPYALDLNGQPTGESAFYVSCNRGKRSIAIDLRKPEGRELIKKLATISDVLLENYKVGTLEKYGLGYAELSKINPRLIYCSITGFGQTGPYASRPGYDTIIQAMGGLMSVTGREDGAPGGGPVRVGAALIDFMTGLYATVAVQAALSYREKTGLGQQIDLSLLDVGISSLANIAMNYLVSGEIPIRRGNRLPTVYPSDAFRCSDGFIMIIIGNDEQFQRFCAATDIESLAQDERFQSNDLRVRNADALCIEITNALSKKPVVHWLATLEKVKVPCSAINNLAQVFDDPQVKARGMRLDLDHPLSGRIPTIANPIGFSKSPVSYHLPPPLLGQHTEEILRDVLSLSNSEIKELGAVGAVVQGNG